MKRFIIPIFLLITRLSYAAPIREMPPRLIKFTENLTTVHASFTQTKILPDITREFKSSGTVTFVPNIGFSWHQTSPKPHEFTSTTETYCTGDGITHKLDELPYFNYTKRAIDKMLGGDISDMLFAFDIDYSESSDSDSWHLIATPSIATISEMIQNITFYGTTTEISKMIITYYDGTIVIMEFRLIPDTKAHEIKC